MFQEQIVKILFGSRIKDIIISIIFFMMILSGCAVQPKPGEMPPSHALKPPPFEIKGVTIEPREFNPYEGEIVFISYSLTRPGKALIMIFDQEMSLIKEIHPDKSDSGKEEVIWDGRDLEDRVVPDEAYFFTIEAITEQGEFAFYDPTTISGGEYINPQVNIDIKNSNISYELTKDARISVRAGITEGPLLKNIVNWSPQFAGMHKIIWDGKNNSGTVDLYKQKGFNILAEAVTLPENSIIAHGNPEYAYYEYKTLMAPDRPKKKERTLFQSQVTLAGLPVQGPREIAPEPRFSIKFTEAINKNEKGLPLISGRIPVKIALDEGLKRITTEQRYEIICFVDFKFITEEESGYSPYTWMWDTADMINGEHALTINIYTLKGGGASETINVVVDNK